MVTFSRTRQGVTLILGIHIASKGEKTRRHKIIPPPPFANRLMRHRQASVPNKLASCDLRRLHFTSNFILHSDFASNNLFVFDLVQNHIQFFSGIKVV